MTGDRQEDFYNRHFGACVTRYKPFDESAVRLVVELTLTCDITSQILSRSMSEFGLSKSSFNVLMLLRHGPAGGMQLHALGELLVVSRANITGLTNHLEQKGYVTRETSDEDRRVRYARITAQAEDLLNRFTPVHLANVERLLSGLTTYEKDRLRAGLTKFRQSLRSHSLHGSGWSSAATASPL